MADRTATGDGPRATGLAGAPPLADRRHRASLRIRRSEPLLPAIPSGLREDAAGLAAGDSELTDGRWRRQRKRGLSYLDDRLVDAREEPSEPDPCGTNGRLRLASGVTASLTYVLVQHHPEQQL